MHSMQTISGFKLDIPYIVETSIFSYFINNFIFILTLKKKLKIDHYLQLHVQNGTCFQMGSCPWSPTYCISLSSNLTVSGSAHWRRCFRTRHRPPLGSSLSPRSPSPWTVHRARMYNYLHTDTLLLCRTSCNASPYTTSATRRSASPKGSVSESGAPPFAAATGEVAPPRRSCAALPQSPANSAADGGAPPFRGRSCSW